MKWINGTKWVVALGVLVNIFVGGCGSVDETRNEEVRQVRQAVGTYTVYNPGWAVAYARNNVSKHSGPFPFPNYDDYGGNCVNFVSQSILAGFVLSDNPATVHSRRNDFDGDAVSRRSDRWFFHKLWDQGSAWTSTSGMIRYAENNREEWSGVHFTYVTEGCNDDPWPLDSYWVEPGDVVFADWTNDHAYDHTMIVTEIKPAETGNNQIRVTSQNSYFDNKGLRDKSYTKTCFLIYRPVDYEPVDF